MAPAQRPGQQIRSRPMASSKAAKRLADETLAQPAPHSAAAEEARAPDFVFEPGQFEASKGGARSLQQRLHETYAPTQASPRQAAIELSPFTQLTVIVTASASLWAVIAV